MSGGGALIDIGVHMLDLALYLMNFPKPVAVAQLPAARDSVPSQNTVPKHC